MPGSLDPNINRWNWWSLTCLLLENPPHGPLILGAWVSIGYSYCLGCLFIGFFQWRNYSILLCFSNLVGILALLVIDNICNLKGRVLDAWKFNICKQISKLWLGVWTKISCLGACSILIIDILSMSTILCNRTSTNKIYCEYVFYFLQNTEFLYWQWHNTYMLTTFLFQYFAIWRLPGFLF